ncbi:hypothetical protein NDU88_003537 [Pleurodeles waltl]|uniref:Uncharacterized protein n=1 Tax=Pleurodeles waltl TaxID=8319 RepID=A0AAV7TQ15_PLEWA|nr:hypothetical protein NDU88_003537 [Pleurodeles waltl]
MQLHPRQGHLEIPAGPAGISPATQEPAPNGASGVAAVRRVQLHPSRFSLPAMQTVKSSTGPWARDSPYHQPFPGSSNHQEKAGGRGTRNPLGSAACGKPPALAVRPRRFRRSRNDLGSIASLLAVLPS